MISFDLRCTNDHVFEAWFANSAAFDQQTDAGDITCPVCGDQHLSKALMAPNVAGKGSPGASHVDDESVPVANGPVDRAEALLQYARALRAEVEKNFDYVGNGFAEEAKKIHYGEVEHRKIYGEMNEEAAEDLRDEGIEFGVLPWPTKDDA